MGKHPHPSLDKYITIISIIGQVNNLELTPMPMSHTHRHAIMHTINIVKLNSSYILFMPFAMTLYAQLEGLITAASACIMQFTLTVSILFF